MVDPLLTQMRKIVSFFKSQKFNFEINRLRANLESLGESVIELPPYSPDLSPCDFFLFGRLKGSFAAALLISDMHLKRRSNTFATGSSNGTNSNRPWTVSWSVGRNASLCTVTTLKKSSVIMIPRNLALKDDFSYLCK